MTVLVGDLQTLALDHDAAVLVIDHHRKPSGFAGDPIDDIVGSTAKSAVADDALGLFISSLTDIAKGNLLPILNDLVIGGHVERCAKRGREVPYRLREGGKKW